MANKQTQDQDRKAPGMDQNQQQQQGEDSRQSQGGQSGRQKTQQPQQQNDSSLDADSAIGDQQGGAGRGGSQGV